jgi:hypothetical protein
MRRFNLLVFAALAVTATPAQTRFASLGGDVTDATGAIISAAVITLHNLDTEWQVKTTSDARGHYAIENIPPGTYKLTASSPGMRSLTVENQPLFIGTTSTRDFSMQVGSVAEQVTATATIALIDSSRSELAQVIEKREVDGLPVLGRGFATLMLLTPNVQNDSQGGGFSVGGQRGFANNFVVDGFTNRNLNGGGQVMTYSQDWIEEFKVSTNGFAAEFGGASGAMVNVITRSGGNNFHGRGFIYDQNDGLNATPSFTKTKPKTSLYRPGGYAGGPIKHDKLFFFGGYEYLHNSGAAIITAPLEPCVPPATKDVAAHTCVSPAGYAQGLYLLKGDWNISPRNIVNQRWSRQRSTDFNSGVGGPQTVQFGRYNDNRYWSYSANWTAVISPSTTNELRGGGNRAYLLGGANAGNTYAILYPSSSLGAPVNHGTSGLDWIQFLDNVSSIRGKHTFKFGGDFNNVRGYGNFRNFRDGRYIMANDKPFNMSDPTTYPLLFTIITGKNTWDYRSNNGGLFAQDSWRLLPNLTLNYGLRWDSDNSVAIAGVNRVNNISPRLGLAWAIGKSHKTVARLAGGLFSDAEHTNLAGIFVLNTLLADKNITLAYSNGALNNPFYTASDPVGSAQRMALYLAQAFAAHTIPNVDSLPGAVSGTNGIDKNFHTPYTGQMTAGVTRLLTSALSTSVDIVYNRAENLLVFHDVNLSRQGTRIDPKFAGESNAAGLGDGRYRSLSVRLDYRATKMAGGFAYTYAKCDDNTSTLLTGGGVTNPYDINADRGPCDNDIRNTLVIRGSGQLPLAFQGSTIYTFRSEPPYTAFKVPLPIFTRYAPRNGLRAATFSSWDVRLSRTFRLTERWKAMFLIEAYNLLNQVNYTGFIGNVSSVQFGHPIGAAARRQMQTGLRVDF